MENNPVLLKSSVFGGFKKKDVLSYIFELNETTQEEKQKLAEQLEELVQSRDSLAANAMEMEQRHASLQSNLDDALARLDEEAAKHARSLELVEALKAEAARQESTVAQQNAEIARQSELNAQMAEKNRVYEEKRRQVELAASQIAELLGQAQEDAAKAVERARQEAEALVENAKQEAEKIVQNAKDSLEHHVGEANKSVDGAYEKFSGFKSGIEKLHASILRATDSISEEMRVLKESMDEVERLVPERLSVDDLPSLQYQQEPVAEEDTDVPETQAEDESPVSVTAAAISPSVEAEADHMTKDILRSYGVRKDDSGFFRLASDQ